MKRSTQFSELLTLAKITRKKIEALSVVEGGQPHLQGYCGVASRHLQLAANKRNLFPFFVAGNFNFYNRILDRYLTNSGHCWLEFEEYIIDITVTQFKNVVTKIDRNFAKKIYISKDTNPHYSKKYVGYDALLQVRKWYEEPIDEICSKADGVAP